MCSRVCGFLLGNVKRMFFYEYLSLCVYVQIISSQPSDCVMFSPSSLNWLQGPTFLSVWLLFTRQSGGQMLTVSQCPLTVTEYER